MPIQIIEIDVPEGYKFRYEVYKLKSLDPNYVESRGRNPTLDASSTDLKPEQEWTVKNRTHVQTYNREYYLKSKAKKRPWRKNRQTRNKHVFTLISRETLIEIHFFFLRNYSRISGILIIFTLRKLFSLF